MNTARNVSTSSPVPIEADQYEQLITLAQGGALQTAAVAGRLFSVCNQAKVQPSDALGTTWTGLGLVNPSGSGVNVIIHQFGWALQIAADDDGAIGLMTSTDSGTTAADLTVQNCLDGSSIATKIYATDSATIATPVLRRAYGDYGTEDTATTLGTIGPHIVNLNGNLIIPPGRGVYNYSTTNPTACFIFHFVWEEVDI